MAFYVLAPGLAFVFVGVESRMRNRRRARFTTRLRLLSHNRLLRSLNSSIYANSCALNCDPALLCREPTLARPQRRN